MDSGDDPDVAAFMADGGPPLIGFVACSSPMHMPGLCGQGCGMYLMMQYALISCQTPWLRQLLSRRSPAQHDSHAMSATCINERTPPAWKHTCSRNGPK